MRGALGKIDAILFDLDGTLIDTAPDMVAVLADLQRAYGLDPLPYQTARAHVSNGALALVRLAFPDRGESDFISLHREYLDRYEASVCVESRLFPGMAELLDDLERKDCPFGIVTNKPSRMTEPLLAALGLTHRLRCAISGDTLPQRKPDPAPLLLGCRHTGTAPERTVYAGDSAKDVAAGRSAGMLTLAAAYGYVVPGDDPAAWGADALAADTKELAAILLDGVKLPP